MLPPNEIAEANMKMKVALNNVMPNPFRHIERYPIREDKIAALQHSIKETDFWENVVARDVGDGTVQIAYGHHRMEALRTMKHESGDNKGELVYPGDTEFDFIIKDIDDTTMCKVMINENMDEWGSDAAIDQESIRAIVQGYADGMVELGKIIAGTPNKQIRYAPHFTQGGCAVSDPAHPYTTTQLMEFTGWAEWKVKSALQGLEAIDSGRITEKMFEGISSAQQKALITEINRCDKRSELEAKIAENDDDELAAKEIRRRGKALSNLIAKTLHDGFENETISTRDAKSIAYRLSFPDDGVDELPDLIPVAQSFALKLEMMLDSEKKMGEQLRTIIQYKRMLDDGTRNSLQMGLRVLADEATELADKLTSKEVN